MTGKNILGIASLILLFGMVMIMLNRNNKRKRIESTLETAMQYGPYGINKKTKDTFRSYISKGYRTNVVMISVNRQYGLYDTITRQYIVPIRYDNISSFPSEGFLHFKQNGKYGFLNRNGQEVVPALYDFVSDFCYGLAPVRSSELWGYIDTTGKLVIPRIYTNALTFSHGVAAVEKNNKWGFINKKGKYIIQPQYDGVSRSFEDDSRAANVSIGSRNFFIDINGKFIRNCEMWDKYEPDKGKKPKGLQ